MAKSPPVGIVQFKRDLVAKAAEFEMELRIVVKKVTVEAFKGVVELTPVWSGRARASWALGISTPSDFTPRELTNAEIQWVKDNKKPIFAAPDVPYAELAKVDGTQPIYITSNLPYMEKLEEGTWSKQAPSGMVRITVRALELGLDNILLKK